MANPILGQNRQVMPLQGLQQIRALIGNKDPKEAVMNLLKSGQMSKQQLDDLIKETQKVLSNGNIGL